MGNDRASDTLMTSPVVQVTNRDGSGAGTSTGTSAAFVIVCEHASNAIPAPLHDLGLDAAALQSHVAWDPGALSVANILSARLDAPLVAQAVSRLVYDCNRPPEAPSAMPERSEIYDIPGNSGLTAAQRAQRVTQIYEPFRNALSTCIDGQVAAGRAPTIVTVHSFTPVYNGVRRDLDIGILHDTDSRFADKLLDCLGAQTILDIQRNEPYGPGDGVTHTLQKHAISRGLLNVMIEIRNDLISDEAGQADIARRLGDGLLEAAEGLGQV